MIYLMMSALLSVDEATKSTAEVSCYIPDESYLKHKEVKSDVLNYSVISQQNKRMNKSFLTVSSVEDLEVSVTLVQVQHAAR